MNYGLYKFIQTVQRQGIKSRHHRRHPRLRLFTAGSGYYLPRNLISKIFESGGTMTIQLYLFMQKANYDEAFATAVVLLVVVLGINGLAKFLSHKFNVEAKA